MNRPRKARRGNLLPFEVENLEKKRGLVELDFVCGRCLDEGLGRHIVGRFVLYPGEERPHMRQLRGGFRPEDAGRPGKALLTCERHNLDKQIGADRAEPLILEQLRKQQSVGPRRVTLELR